MKSAQLLNFISVLLFLSRYGNTEKTFPGFTASSLPLQNSTFFPFPYQTALGQNPFPIGQQENSPVFPSQADPYSSAFNYGAFPNSRPINWNPYYSPLASGYQYPGMRMPYGGGLPQQYFGGGYQGMMFQPGNPISGGFGQTRALNFQQLKPNNAYQPDAEAKSNNDTNETIEILDVPAEYQRQILGWKPQSSSKGDQGPSRRYKVDFNTKTSNVTSIPNKLTKPIVSEKHFTTSIKRTFVFDSSKPGKIEPINLHIVNGQTVTEPPVPETTVNEDVEGINMWYEDRKYNNI